MKVIPIPRRGLGTFEYANFSRMAAIPTIANNHPIPEPNPNTVASPADANSLCCINKEPPNIAQFTAISGKNIPSWLYNDGEYFNWVITQREDGKIVGAINLKPNHEDDSVMFSYAIDNRFTGKGYMTEALTKVKEYDLQGDKI